MVLTWRDVAAPDFSASIAARRGAQEALNGGFSVLQDALKNYGNEQKTAQNGAILADLARYNNLDDYNAAAAKLGNAPMDVDTFNAVMNGRTTRLTDANKAIQNNEASFNLGVKKRDDALIQSQLAAQPEAMKKFGEIRLLAGSGDPADAELAAKMVVDNVDLWNRVGYQPSQINSMLNNERAAARDGFKYRKEVLDNGKFWEGVGISDEAQKIAFGYYQNGVLPADAITAIKRDKSIKDPRVAEAAINAMKTMAGADIYMTPSAAEETLIKNGILPATLGKDSSILPGVKDPANGVPKDVAAQQASDVMAAQPGAVNLGDPNSELGAAANFLYQEEGFRSEPYFDVNAHRAGLGSDTTVREDGTVVKITPDTRVSKEDAARDVQYRLTQREGKKAREQIGDQWNSLPVNVKTALYSVAYNYGSLPNTVVEAVKTGDVNQMAQAVAGLSANKDRRAREAQLILGQSNATVDRDRQSWTDSLGTTKTPDNYPQVDPNQTAATQEYLDGVRKKSINQDIADLTSGIDGGGVLSNSIVVEKANSLWDYYTKTPEEGAKAKLERDQARGTANFFAENADFFRENPGEIAKAKADPYNYAANFGNTEAQMTYLAKRNAALVDGTKSAETDAAPADKVSEALGAVDVAEAQNNADNLKYTAELNKAFGGNTAVIRKFLNGINNPEMTDTRVAEELVKDGGDISGGNKEAVLEAIRETMRMTKGSLTPAAAGVIVAHNMENRDLTADAVWYKPWNSDTDRFSKEGENKAAAPRANMENVAKTVETIGRNVDGSINVARFASQARNVQNEQVANVSLSEIQASLVDNAKRLSAAYASYKMSGDPAKLEEIKIIEQQNAQLNELLNKLSASGNLSINIDAQNAIAVPSK